MLRLSRLAPLVGLVLAFTAACGDDGPENDDPSTSAGAGGEPEVGGKGGGSAGKPSAGSKNEPGGAGATSEGGSMSGGGEGGAPVAVDCSKLATAPAEVEVLSGFVGSEDFVFDELGNYVGVDQDNNLVRISKEGKKALWAPNVGKLIAGMAMLPDGSVILADYDVGALKRVYPNGAIEILLGGLLYPNGLDIGPDGYIYVAENNGGRVRRVNPDNGEFTVVAMGLFGPNGVAFSDDPGLLYVGSFEGAGVYKLQLAKPGELGKASVFAKPPGSTLPEPKLACPEQEVGKACTPTMPILGDVGVCKQLANVVDCFAVNPCEGKPDGEKCSGGTCQGEVCIPDDPCVGNPTGPGCCGQPVGTGGNGPGPVVDGCCGKDCGSAGASTGSSPCDGLAAGDACVDWFGAGKCADQGGVLVCEQVNPCDGLAAGDTCTDPNWGAGVCTDDGSGYLYCELPNPCEGKPDGEACTSFDGPGSCEGGYCYPSPCADAKPGDNCWSFDAGSGVCVGSEGGPLECVNPCQGKSDGDTCAVGANEGQCLDDACALTCTADTIGSSCILDGELGYCLDDGSGPVCHGNDGPSSGGIDGLGVDACGNVYASQYTTGNLWRVSPTGEIEKLAKLPSGWIPNIKWGRGLGGFDRNTMYVADRDEGRLFGVAVGAPGATEYYDIGAKP